MENVDRVADASRVNQRARGCSRINSSEENRRAQNVAGDVVRKVEELVAGRIQQQNEEDVASKNDHCAKAQQQEPEYTQPISRFSYPRSRSSEHHRQKKKP